MSRMLVVVVLLVTGTRDEMKLEKKVWNEIHNGKKEFYAYHEEELHAIDFDFDLWHEGFQETFDAKVHQVCDEYHKVLDSKL